MICPICELELGYSYTYIWRFDWMIHTTCFNKYCEIYWEVIRKDLNRGFPEDQKLLVRREQIKGLG